MRAYFVLPLAKTAEGIELRGRDLSARKISSSKLLRTDKMSRQKMPSQFVGLPSPRLRGLNLFACYIGEKESARRRAANTAEGIDPARAPRKFIPKQRAQNCFAPANKTDGKTPSVFFAGLPTYARRGLFLGLVLCRNKYKRDRKALP